MPVLIHSISENLHKLLKNGGLAPIALLRELGRVMKMAIHIALVLVVRVLCTEHSGAHGASEVLNVVLALQRSDIRSSQGSTTGIAKQIESFEVVGFAQRILSRSLVWDRKEFRGNDLATVLSTNQHSIIC